MRLATAYHARRRFGRLPTWILLFAEYAWAGDAPSPPGEPAVPPAGTSGTSPPAANGEYAVDFRAGRVDVDAKLNELELADDVVVVVDRYRLTADRLRLRRSDRGIVVDGDGRVAFCRCSDPPVTLSFSEATVAPPTDLLIEDPTLRVLGVPVLWLPYLWLRSPDRIGLRPPRVAYSSEDGLLAGAGVHLPVSKDESFVDLEAAGYLQGGVDTRLRLATPSNSARVRFDHLKSSMLAVDARGVAHVPGLTTAAYRVDAIRGPRALRATPVLLEAAQRFDRARGELGRHHGFGYYGVGASATAARGEPFRELGAWGPFVSLGGGEALAGIGDVAAHVTLQTSEESTEGALTMLQQQGSARFHARPGPMATELELFEQLGVSSTAMATERFAMLGARAELSLPLRRRFGDDDPLLHYVTPLALGSGVHVIQSDGLVISETNDAGQLSAGVRSALGRWGRQSAVQIEARAGLAGTGSEVQQLAAAEMLGQSHYFAAAVDAVTHTDVTDRWALSSRVRIGPEFGHHVSIYAEGQRDIEMRLARLMSGDVLTQEPWLEWYDRAGLSSGAEVMVRVGPSLSGAVGADVDVDREALLGMRGSLAYRHPCGCLAAVAWAGHRIGRRGVDAWLTVDLIP